MGNSKPIKGEALRRSQGREAQAPPEHPGPWDVASPRCREAGPGHGQGYGLTRTAGPGGTAEMAKCCDGWAWALRDSEEEEELLGVHGAMP